MTDPGDDAGGPEVGSLGEEAAKLLGAVGEWARDRGLADQVGAAASALEDHLATGAPECTYCPLCRTVHVVREASPEVRAHLATAASSFLQAVAGVLSSLPPPGPVGGSGPGLEKIDLDDPDGDDP